MAITVPYSFTDSTTAYAAEVNADFAAIIAKALDKTGDTITGTVSVTGTLNAGGATGLVLVSSQAAGDLIYAASATTFARIAKGTAYQVFHMNSGATAGAWTSTLGTTGTRLTAGFFTDLTVTNAIAGSVTGNAATVTGLSVTAGQTLTVTTGGTIGSAAYTASTAYEPALGNPAGDAYVLASTTGGTRSWVSSSTPGAHQLDGAAHTVSGLTTGHFLKATGATTFGFAAHGLTYSDVGADVAGAATSAVSSHAALTTGVHGLAITAGQTLTVTTGGTLGSAAYTASTAYDVAGAAAAVTPTTLGLVIGTNVQAYNSNLTAINQALTTTSSPSFTAVTTNVTGNVSGSSGSCTGLAATATALATARAINGVNFDGTAAITVTAAAGTLSGTTLNATVVTSSLTAVGTITTGTWNAGAVTSSVNASAPTTALTLANLVGDGNGAAIDWFSGYGSKVTGRAWSSASGSSGAAWTFQLLRQSSGTLTDTLSFDNTGAATFAAGISATTGAFSGDFSVATTKFTVASATGNTVVAGTLDISGNTYIAATKGFYFDGGSNTYITEKSADTLAVYAAATEALTITGSSVTIQGNGIVVGTLTVDSATSAIVDVSRASTSDFSQFNFTTGTAADWAIYTQNSATPSMVFGAGSSLTPVLTITQAGNTTIAGTLTAAGNVGIAATNKIYLDGVAMTGDTYITESSANVLDFYVGGIRRFTMQTTDMTAVSSTLGNDATGNSIKLGRNLSNNTAPANIGLMDKAGTYYYIWVDTTGDLRVGTTAPVATDGTDTGGTIVGTQS